MLNTLRRIVQEVNAAQDLAQALAIIVSRVKAAMSVDVCSVYLLDAVRDEYVLKATDGLNPEAIDTVRLARGEGLISVVGASEEPLNLENAPAHPRYRFVAETGEERFYGFLGVPIIQHRKVMGVLVVRQREQRSFGEDEVALLLTVAAQLAGAIAHAEAIGGLLGPIAPGDDSLSRAIDGLPGAPGVSVGTAVVAYPLADLAAVPDRPAADVALEITAFRQALAATRDDIRVLGERLGTSLSAEERALFDAYQLMLGSESLEEKTVERIQAGLWAPAALRETILEHARVFDAMEDTYLRERAQDVRDLGRRILVRLQNEVREREEWPEATILVGEEISATMLTEVPVERLVGVVSVRGSSSSHVAILARALGIPSVVGASDLPVSRIDGSEVVIDGYRGRLYVSPSDQVRTEYQRLAREEQELAAELVELRELPAVTRDGIRVPLYANTGLLSDVSRSIEHGAEGVGLYRTEFPFMIRTRFPGEEEQRRIYREVLEAFAPRPVTVRTLDIGGDKMLSYFPIHEDNPFLGWRGIRVTLDHPEIFIVQIRAILRASAGLGNLRLLLPMVSDVAEVDAALRIVRRVHQELRGAGEDIVMPQVGVMIEVPSTLYQIDSLAPRVDFFSVGTNDLTQYMLAVDRNNTRVASLYDSLHPAVLRALTQVVLTAQRCNKPVGVCGEMAGDPAAVILLLGMGVANLSATVTSLSRVKWVIRNVNIGDARNALDQVLLMEDVRQIRGYLNGLLEEAGVGSLLRAGK